VVHLKKELSGKIQFPGKLQLKTQNAVRFAGTWAANKRPANKSDEK
jgi:hypothetical protein